MNIQGGLDSIASGVTSAQKGFNTVFKQPTQVMNYLPDASALIGPVYDYSGELKSPEDLGIRMGDGSLSGIGRAAAGVDYYAGALGYGRSIGISKKYKKMKQNPMGLNFFLKVADAKLGAACSNGASMYEYVSTIPTGIPGPLGDKLAEEMKGVRLQGLAPGIIGDAAAALNPAPFFSAAVGSGFPQCKQMRAMVGDAEGNIRSKNPNVTRPWIDISQGNAQKPKRKLFKKKDNKYYETHWVFDKWISAEEYNNTPKIYPRKIKKGKKTIIEDFLSEPFGGSNLAAGVLFAALFIGIVAFKVSRK
jgi:hypothetical protein